MVLTGTFKLMKDNTFILICRISVEEAKDDRTKGRRYPEYDINGYRKDHRVKNVKFTSKFDKENPTYGKKNGRLSEMNTSHIFRSPAWC